MRPLSLLSRFLLAPLLCALPLQGATAAATTAPLAERLAGSWTCQAKEGGSDIAMTLDYRRSAAFLVGEIVEDNGAALLDIWLDDGASVLSLRRVVSYDATIEMEVSVETENGIELQGEMRHVLGSTAKVRETIRFSGADDFHAVWEAYSGESWQTVMDRSCRRR